MERTVESQSPAASQIELRLGFRCNLLTWGLFLVASEPTDKIEQSPLQKVFLIDGLAVVKGLVCSHVLNALNVCVCGWVKKSGSKL